MKRQNLLDGLPYLVIQGESNSGLRFLLAALEFQAQFNEEQFFKDHANVCGGPKRLESMNALAFIRPMHLPQRLTRTHQVQPLANRRRDSLRQLGCQLFQRAPNDPAKPSRGELPLACRLINWNDSPDLQRL